MKIWLEHDVAQKKIINGTCLEKLQTTKQSFSHKVMYQHAEFINEIFKLILILFNFS